MTARRAGRAALRVLLLAGAVPMFGSCAGLGRPSLSPSAVAARQNALSQARVWRRTDIPRMDMRRGPGGKGSFAPDALVDCRYEQQAMSGNTPKFTCVRPNGEELKVKFGERNGEVYAEVAATRLLWALGFGADHMYPVRVRCHGCPETPGGPPRPGTTQLYETAAVERKLPGREIDGLEGGGWTWPELDVVGPARADAARAERDALKLLAAMLQHTDSKREQQRLICLDGKGKGKGKGERPCRRPFMLVSDLGKTFGKANAFNRDAPGSVNLKTWSEAPVWADATGCRANLGKSLTGTLEHPVISDEGRRFLVGLLRQLTDRQLREMFAVARFPERAGAPTADVGAWVGAFKVKVKEIADRTCPDSERAS